MNVENNAINPNERFETSFFHTGPRVILPVTDIGPRAVMGKPFLVHRSDELFETFVIFHSSLR
jgi:hypothetical protein